MSALQKHHIVDLFVWVDDSLPVEVKCRVRPVLRDSELLTILIWDGLTEPRKTLSAVYTWIEREYLDYFPKLPKYRSLSPAATTTGLVSPDVTSVRYAIALRGQHHTTCLQADLLRKC